MHLIEIKHYVANSLYQRPSFVLAMSDGKDYISNGCVFVVATDENMATLVRRYDCKKHIDELFASSSIEISAVTDASYMFWGCKTLTTFNSDMPAVIYANYMFDGCELLK